MEYGGSVGLVWLILQGLPFSSCFLWKNIFHCSDPTQFFLEFIGSIVYNRASLVAPRLKRLPGMLETRVRSLGWEDPLEKGMATHSSILAWRICGWRRLVGYSPRGCKELDTTEQLHFTSLHFIVYNVQFLYFTIFYHYLMLFPRHIYKLIWVRGGYLSLLRLL